MKILVTGVGGFIGRHVVTEATRRGHVVRGMVRPSTDSTPSLFQTGGIEIAQQDLRRTEGLSRVTKDMDAVIHCAAAMSGDFETQQAVTVEGTRNLLAAMKETGVKQIIGLSTFAVYDYLGLAAGSLLDEDSPLEEHLDARAPYIRVKMQQEDLIRKHCAESGWKWTILRPGIVFGKGRTWFHHLGMQLGSSRWVCLAGESLLPLTYVENCAEAVLNALESNAANAATLNIVDDNLPERRRYMDEIAKRTQPRPAVSGIPWSFLDSVSRTASWTNRTLLFGKAPLPDLLLPASLHARCKPLRYTNERAKQALRWKPRWNLIEGLDRSFSESSATEASL